MCTWNCPGDGVDVFPVKGVAIIPVGLFCTFGDVWWFDWSTFRWIRDRVVSDWQIDDDGAPFVDDDEDDWNGGIDGDWNKAVNNIDD